MATKTVDSTILSNGNRGQEVQREYLEYLDVRTANRLFSQPVDEIDFFTAEANYVGLHVGAQVFRIRCTMKNLELRLDRREFVRIHRRIIVNLNRVTQCRAFRRGDHIVTLQGAIQLKMTHRYRVPMSC